jgi:peptidoglycan/xylan/chitin deacetylase (PgdA/CDA1 family)
VSAAFAALAAVTLFAGTPSGPAAPRPESVPVPVLIYHVIAPAPAGAPFPGLYVPPPRFVSQMDALASSGYQAVTLDQVWRAWHGDGGLPARPVVISFDNGYRTQYTRALPVLRRLGWVGDENLQLTGLPPAQGGLSVEQIRGLVSAHWELDTQGYDHVDLIGLNPAQLRYQISAARTVIRRRFHVPADWFCYPSGDYNATVVAEVRAAGYVGATTVVAGWARPGEDPYRLPRLRVLGGTSAPELLALIADARVDPPPPPAYPPRG